MKWFWFLCRFQNPFADDKHFAQQLFNLCQCFSRYFDISLASRTKWMFAICILIEEAEGKKLKFKEKEEEIMKRKVWAQRWKKNGNIIFLFGKYYKRRADRDGNAIIGQDILCAIASAVFSPSPFRLDFFPYYTNCFFLTPRTLFLVSSMPTS